MWGRPPDRFVGSAERVSCDLPQASVAIRPALCSEQRLCGFRISGQRLFIVPDMIGKNESSSAAVEVEANVVVEIDVEVNLESQTVTAEAR